MAYVIGSQKGKDIAKNMTAGSTYKASDGSTWTKKSDGSVSVTTSAGETFNNAYKPTSSGGTSGYSQYTGSSNGIITNNSTQQSIKDKMNANSIAWWSADEAGKKQLEAANKELAALLGGSVAYNADTGTWGGNAEGIVGTTKDDILGWEEDYEQDNPKQEYEAKYDPQIEALLNEILNRDDFSYDVMNDPLYQQYAKSYQREGDRAMKETMAEAAAGAGGMNTYAITAAQQANSYYNSMLNDKIPELYQLAYEMYLKDKESKVQDLGLLQSMDATQYNRYRDTISDYYNDKNFAYGAFMDAVGQGNWQANYDYNAMWDNNYFNNDNYWKNKEFNYNDYWNNKEFDYNDEWKNKEWDANQADKEYERNESKRQSAEDKMMTFVDLGKMPSDDIIAQAGWNKADVEVLVAAAQAQLAKTGGSGGGNKKKSGGDDSNYTGIVEEKEEDEDSYTGNDKTTEKDSWLVNDNMWATPEHLPITQTAKNFETVYNDCKTMSKTDAKNYLAKVKTTGAIDNVQYNWLMNEFAK